MKRFIICVLGIAYLLILAGCASTPLPVDREHRMIPYVPNIGSGPTGIPANVVTAGPVPIIEPDGAVDPGRQHRLTPGDEVLTSLRGIPKPEDIRNVVDTSGNLTMPLIGQVSVAGLSASEAERMIEEKYIQMGFFRSINVIMVSEDKSYFVQGEVGRQGRFRLAGEITLLKAITEAGGYSPFANRRNVKVIRGDDVIFFNARDIANGREPDPVIQANDIVVVLRSVF